MMVVFSIPTPQSHISGQCADEVNWEMGWRGGSRREEGKSCLGMESQKVQERSQLEVGEGISKQHQNQHPILLDLSDYSYTVFSGNFFCCIHF